MGFGSGWSVAAKPCDSCKSAAAAVFCRVDAAALCFGCDTRLHARSAPSTHHHERVWMCEVCEQAPAAVTCKADAAALCVSCDTDIHSANPLAQRHERVPVQPFFDSAESFMKSSALSFLILPGDEAAAATAAAGGAETGGAGAHDHDGEAEMDKWLLPNLNSCSKVMPGADMGGFFSEMDPFIDFGFGDPVDRFQGIGSDGLVPVQAKPIPIPAGKQSSESRLDIDFSRPNNRIASSFSYLTNSLSHSVSSSSLEVGVVPDGNSNMSDISYPLVQTSGDSSLANSASPTQSSPATQLTGMDREARVLRFREKRKNRKFEKTIRYASRKAYAETRPRIKGRFAKRTEVEPDDSLYGAAHQYGVVPTF
ncbi:zinc finger protein CONSTANS-LIKE 5-like [Punica granatum]|nr:zinc finger protein CONSTANS-LIKE 5-like [Punica granatum]